jgi:hypothetical protein
VKIVKETVAVETAEPGFVHVTQHRVKDTGQDIGGQLWFERENLRWVIDTLRACLSTYGFPETVLQRGQDSLKVFESGPEQAPLVNLFNVRPRDVEHGGVFARSLSRIVAEELADQLAAIG